MRKVILFIAMSLDGFIADTAGGVSWLTGQDSRAENADSYSVFEKSIDTVIMGWNTYHQIITELSPDQWVYENLQSYVITHRVCTPADGITFTAENPCKLVKDLVRKDGKNIWICGGADIIHQLMRMNLIDIYHISVIPTILGNGIRLFDTLDHEIKLRLTSVEYCNGITELIYHKR